MEDLPQELIDRISSYLERDDLRNTLVLSRKFQFAAENYSGAFAEFEINADSYTHDGFLERFGGRRFRYLRVLRFRTSFPALEWDDETMDIDDDMPPCRSDREELKQMDELFSAQIRTLFSTLKELEDRLVSADLSDIPEKLKLYVYTPTRDIDQNMFCLHHTFTSWRVHLLEPDVLPVVKLVRVLKIKNGAELAPFNDYEQDHAVGKLDSRVLLDLARKLPNLAQLKCRLGGDEWPSSVGDEVGRHFLSDWEGPRRDSRRDFANFLGSAMVPSLRHLDLDFIHPLLMADLIDQRQEMPDLVTPALHDPFSNNLRILSYQLRRMILRGVFDETLFWPTDSSSELPQWPRLEYLSVMFHISTPSGTWYFKGLFNEGATQAFEIADCHYPPLTTTTEDEERDNQLDRVIWDECSRSQYRVLPDDDVLTPFLRAFAQATSTSMPSLKQACLWCPLRLSAQDVSNFYEDYDWKDIVDVSVRETRETVAWGINYAKPGEKVFDSNGRGISSERRLWWRVGTKWKPDNDLHELFRAIGKEQGRDLIEGWNDDYYGPGLADRGIFEELENDMRIG